MLRGDFSPLEIMELMVAAGAVGFGLGVLAILLLLRWLDRGVVDGSGAAPAVSALPAPASAVSVRVVFGGQAALPWRSGAARLGAAQQTICNKRRLCARSD